MARLSTGEILRKITHMAVGLIAFALRDLGPANSALLALTAVLFNAFVLPRIGGRRLWRGDDVERGHSLGIVLYPVAVLLLVLIFWQRLEVAAAIWAILAFGDGMASVVGMSLGRSKLPWNQDKSWAGTLAYFLFGAAGATILLQWTAPGAYPLAFAVAVCGATALVAALLESLPLGLDDNIGVPLVSGLCLLGLLQGLGGWSALATPEGQRLLWVGAGVNLLLGAVAYAGRTVSVSGAVAGFLVGTAIYATLGWQGYLLLLTFFVLGSGATKLGYKRKAAAGLAQEKGGRRGASNAIANTGVAVACALFAATTPHYALYALAFAAAFATAAADTSSSEIGQVWGRRTYLVTTFRPVPAGTEGAVSLEGTLAGIAASALVGGLGAALGLYPWSGVLLVVIAAFIGTTLESLLGATLEKRGLLDNEAINFLNTLIGALAAVGLAVLTGLGV